MKTKLSALALLLPMLAITLSIQAQVGINKDTPDSCAIFQVSDNYRGVIFPQIASDNSLHILPLSDGLLYYNNSEHRFRYYNGSRWQCLNPWSGSPIDTNLITTTKSVTIKSSLAVSTSISVGATSLTPTTVKATNIIADNASIATITVSSEVNAALVTADNFLGNGIIPIGGIIMWSGARIPDGWAICNGGTTNGHITPDLRGRFIVASGQNQTPDARETNNPTYSMGNTGGINNYALTIAEMPSHNHTSNAVKKIQSITYDSGKSDGNSVAWDNNDTEGMKATIDSNGGGTAHENRPTYYVLAFIMRVQ